MDYNVADFAYNLPSELIAQKPSRPRDHSRLLVLDKENDQISHRHFFDIVDYLRPGDLLILNDSKVFPARLIGHKAETGGVVEIFLHKKLSASRGKDLWECLIGGRVKEGLKIEFNVSVIVKDGTDKLRGQILKNNQDGTWQVEFNATGHKFFVAINKIGEVPLPPYIKRLKHLASDQNNYQTVFANDKKIGSAAAPTAGLHFTQNLLKKIRANGVKIEYVTLHVGLGTFAPVKVEKISDHKMHSEFVEVKTRTLAAILKIKQSGGRVIAVGTTSCRTLESLDWSKYLKNQPTAQLAAGKIRPESLKSESFWTNIFIYPGYKFKIVDALITNFHLPKSTLLMLVSALAGKENIDRAYQAAIKQNYRFFSYGDAMLIY